MDLINHIIKANPVVIISLILLLYLMYSLSFIRSSTWQATITPLASIIGSGFLVSAPLIVLTTGKWAVLTITIIVCIAYLLGDVIRFNIRHTEKYINNNTHPSNIKVIILIEKISHLLLGIAYIISVAFYLKLLSAFSLRLFAINSILLENSLTTLILLFIGVVGWIRGLQVLEILEKYAVNLKLLIIGVMLIGFFSFNLSELANGNWHIKSHGHMNLFSTFKKLLGILLIVQGFETSRYMGELYSAQIRIRTMKYAQIISGLIYILFIAFSMILFNDIHKIDETVIIDLSKIVSPILPFLLVVAAVMSQFSAAVADSIGSSGLISESANKSISTRDGVIITVIFALLLVWFTNIYGIIVIASKAFASYYGMQCIIAIIASKRHKKFYGIIKYIALFILMVLVLFLGEPVE